MSRSRSPPTRVTRAAPARPAVTLTGQHLTFAYDLATGEWTLRSDHHRERFQMTSLGRITLVHPKGVVAERNLSDARPLTRQEVRAVETSGHHRCEIRRAFADGLIVCQRFVVGVTTREFQVEVAVHPPPRYPLAVRTLVPIAPAGSDATNLSLAPWGRYPRLLDLGWTATEPLGVGDLRGNDEMVATGFAALGCGDARSILVLGFLDARRAVGQVRVRPAPASTSGELTGHFALVVGADVGTIDLPPSGVSTGPVWLSLEPLATSFRRFAQLRRTGHVPSQSTTLTSVILRPAAPPSVPRAAFPASSPPNAHPPRASHPENPAVDGGTLAAIQTLAASSRAGEANVLVITEGGERATGEWWPSRSRLPEGLAAAREAIRQGRWRAGLALAPFLTARSADLTRAHPTWLQRSAAGDPILVAGDEGDTYALDASQVEVQEWLVALGRRLSREWGFDLVRCERLSAAVQSGWRARGRESPLDAYRRGLRALREGLAGAILVAAGAPLFATLDLADVVETSAAPLRRADPTPFLRSFLRETGPRTSAGPTYVNLSGQSLEEARAAVTIATFGGSAVDLAENPACLPPERAELLRVALPPYDGAIFPLDPFAPGGPRLFATRPRCRWDEWLVVVALNPAEVATAVVAPFQILGLSGRYHAYEFWEQSYLGILRDRLTLEHVPPGGCRVVALRAVRSEPQIVGTSLHLSQGAVDLADVAFDRSAGRLRLAAGAVGDREGSVAVALPRGWTPGSIRGTGGGFAVELVSDRLARLHLRFREVANLELDFFRPTSSEEWG